MGDGLAGAAFRGSAVQTESSSTGATDALWRVGGPDNCGLGAGGGTTAAGLTIRAGGAVLTLAPVGVTGVTGAAGVGRTTGRLLGVG